MIEIPYSKDELRFAVLGVKEEQLDEKKLDAFFNERENKVPKDKKEWNKKAAEFHGITVEQLINSPNYKILSDECIGQFIKQLVEKLQERLGITDKQAWAFILVGMGLIKIE